MKKYFLLLIISLTSTLSAAPLRAPCTLEWRESKRMQERLFGVIDRMGKNDSILLYLNHLPKNRFFVHSLEKSLHRGAKIHLVCHESEKDKGFAWTSKLEKMGMTFVFLPKAMAFHEEWAFIHSETREDLFISTSSFWRKGESLSTEIYEPALLQGLWRSFEEKCQTYLPGEIFEIFSKAPPVIQ